jgi:hypothetical protein
MTTNSLAYEEVADFIAALDPSKLLELKPSKVVQSRVNELINEKSNNGLSSENQYELDRYLALEHLISLAKIRARRYLNK